MSREVALRQIIDDFEAANPDFRIQVEPQVWDRMTPQRDAIDDAH